MVHGPLTLASCACACACDCHFLLLNFSWLCACEFFSAVRELVHVNVGNILLQARAPGPRQDQSNILLLLMIGVFP